MKKKTVRYSEREKERVREREESELTNDDRDKEKEIEIEIEIEIGRVGRSVGYNSRITRDPGGHVSTAP